MLDQLWLLIRKFAGSSPVQCAKKKEANNEYLSASSVIGEELPKSETGEYWETEPPKSEYWVRYNDIFKRPDTPSFEPPTKYSNTMIQIPCNAYPITLSAAINLNDGNPIEIDETNPNFKVIKFTSTMRKNYVIKYDKYSGRLIFE